MSKYLICGLLACVLSAPAMAEKPVYAGDGKPTAEQKATHKGVMTSKADEYKVQQERLKKQSGGQDHSKIPDTKAH